MSPDSHGYVEEGFGKTAQSGAPTVKSNHRGVRWTFKRTGTAGSELRDNQGRGQRILSQVSDFLTNIKCQRSFAKCQYACHISRHQRDLKKREDAFLSEIDTFHATESRLMSNLRDVLEIESSNMSEAVARLDAVIKGECTLEDAELVRLKTTFAEGLEYLRNFQPDADELFNRKLRFSAGEDAARLPQAITTCGELCVLVPQFAGRTVLFYFPNEPALLSEDAALY
ncbi:hypothetical protein COOONC_04769 [Cooperia oncophora]